MIHYKGVVLNMENITYFEFWKMLSPLPQIGLLILVLSFIIYRIFEIKGYPKFLDFDDE